MAIVRPRGQLERLAGGASELQLDGATVGTAEAGDGIEVPPAISGE